MTRIVPHRRPHYPPVERMAVLQLKTIRGWSAAQAGRAFHLAPATIATWLKRLDEQGPAALVQLPPKPVNRFPDFARYIIQQLKTLCPSLGKVKIAQTLARSGLHIAATTVGRILKEEPISPNSPSSANNTETASVDSTEENTKPRVVTAKYPNHVWHVDITVVPIIAGFWTTWLPNALPQVWPPGNHHQHQNKSKTSWHKPSAMPEPRPNT